MGLVLGGGSLLNQVGRELNTAMERALAPLEVTAQQAALLLHTRGSTTPSQLADLLGTDSAGMTRLLDRLEDKGLLRRVRHPGDRRSVVVELTGRGQVGHQLFAGFTTTEITQITTLLQRMLTNLGGPRR
jgi:DNA-binding MarR family transcriptional regulator